MSTATTSAIQTHQFNSFSIPQRESDGYVSLTRMAEAYPSKKMNNFLRSKQTNAYLEALSVNTQKSVLDLITTNVGGSHSGTWAHPEVSVKFAAWLSPEFEVWAMRTLVKVINGNTPQPEPKYLPGPTIAEQMHMMKESFDFFGIGNSPRHIQLARDHFANLMQPQNSLPSTPSAVKWMGVTEIAEGLGFDKNDVADFRIPLGRFAASWHRAAFKEEPSTEERIVNGRMCPVKVYKPIPEFESAIFDFLRSKGL